MLFLIFFIKLSYLYSDYITNAETEQVFNVMKMAGCSPDIITYTAMLHAFNFSSKILF